MWGGDGSQFLATEGSPQILWLEALGDGKYRLRGPGQWLGTEASMYELLDLGGGQFALVDGGSYVLADYNAGGFLTTNTGLINDWWRFTIQPSAAPADPHPLRYLAANPDLQPIFGHDPAAALAHYQQYGWSEGRPTDLPTATLASGFYSVQGQQGYVGGDGTQFLATESEPQVLRLEERGNGQYSLRGEGQWLGDDWVMHTGPMSADKAFPLLEMGGDQFALVDGDAFVLADYNAGGFLTANPGLINDWWMFTIQPIDGPADPDPGQYQSANPDLPSMGIAQALEHWRSTGWAEGRPTSVPTATLGSGFYTIRAEDGYLFGDGSALYATHADPQILRLEGPGRRPVPSARSRPVAG